MIRILSFVLLGSFLVLPVRAELLEASTTASVTSQAPPAEKPEHAASSGKKKKDGEKSRAADRDTSSSEEALVRTEHTIQLSSGPLAYTATAAYMPLRNESGELEAKIFYTYYAVETPDDEASTRPLVFLFNGGPGSSSIWLHMGAFGPRRARLNDDGTLPPPPYELVDNDETLLTHADLVFVDPVGTGFSRPAKPDQGKKYWGVQQDLTALGEFVRLFLVRNERMRSPLFLAGESYGTFRAAGLASHLLDKNIALNGIILISTILDFRPTHPAGGNELPYAIYVPTYTAAAWYHGLLPEDLQKKPLADALREAEQWATTTFTLALMRGDALSGDERRDLIAGLARYTGLSPEFIDRHDLRFDDWQFRKELLRDRRRSLSVYDARLLAIEPKAAGEGPDFDPILGAMGAPYTMLFNDYIRRELGFRTDLEYVTLSGAAHGAWDYGDPRSSSLMDMSEALRKAMSRNTAMRAFVARGLYDFATPYFAAAYTFDHLGLDPEVRGNVRTEDYEGGHMMYIDRLSRRKLTSDVISFLDEATP